MKLYIKVTSDEYELPIAVADSKSELAKMVGVSTKTVRGALYAAKKRGGTSTYKEVEVEDE